MNAVNFVPILGAHLQRKESIISETKEASTKIYEALKVSTRQPVMLGVDLGIKNLLLKYI